MSKYMIYILIKIYRDSLLRNSVYIMTANFTNSILGFFFWVVAARYYMPNDIGIASAILSGILLISMISSMGLPKALMFYLPRDYQNVNKIINSCFIVCIISSIMFSMIFILGLEIWAPQLLSTLDTLDNVIIFTVVTIATTLSALISSTFMAGRKSAYYTIRQTTFDFIKILPLAIFAGFGAIGIFLSLSIGYMLSIALGFILLSKIWKYSPTIAIDPIIKSMASFSFGNHIADVFYNLPRFIFPIMILNLMSDKAAGFFFIAMAVATLLYGVSQSIANSLIVESSSEEELRNNVGKAIRFNIGLTFIGIISFMIFGKFVLTLFSPSYADSALMTLIILTVASIPLSLINIFTAIRNIQKRVMSVVKINTAVAIMALILSVPLMKMMGIEGVAIAYLAANTIVMITIMSKIKNLTIFTLKLIKEDLVKGEAT